MDKFSLGSTSHAEHMLRRRARTTLADSLAQTVRHIRSLLEPAQAG